MWALDIYLPRTQIFGVISSFFMIAKMAHKNSENENGHKYWGSWYLPKAHIKVVT